MGPRKARVIDAWSSPPIVVLKFNVDDAAHGKLRPAGVGGILRNHTWEVLLNPDVFQVCGSEGLIMMQVLAILEDLCIYSLSFPGT